MCSDLHGFAGRVFSILSLEGFGFCWFPLSREFRKGGSEGAGEGEYL